MGGDVKSLGDVRLWNIESQQQVVLLEHSGVRFVIFSPDGKTIISWDYDNNDIHLWDLETKQEVAQLEAGFPVFDFSPDGKTIAFASSGTIQLVDLETKQQVGALSSRRVDSLAFSPDGKILVSGGRDGIRFWDVEILQETGRLDGTGPVAFSPDGKFLATVVTDGIRLWDAESQEQVALLEGRIVSAVAFSFDGKWLASGRSDGTVLLWEVNVPPGVVAVQAKGKQHITLGEIKRTALLQNYPNPFNPETWIPFILAEDADAEIAIYDINGQLVQRLELGHRVAGVYQNRN